MCSNYIFIISARYGSRFSGISGKKDDGPHCTQPRKPQRNVRLPFETDRPQRYGSCEYVYPGSTECRPKHAKPQEVNTKYRPLLVGRNPDQPCVCGALLSACVYLQWDPFNRRRSSRSLHAIFMIECAVLRILMVALLVVSASVRVEQQRSCPQ